MKEEKEEEKKSSLRKWAQLSGIAIQMGGTIFVCAWIGKSLDEKYTTGETNWFTLGFVLFGLLASLYLVIKQLKELNK